MFAPKFQSPRTWHSEKPAVPNDRVKDIRQVFKWGEGTCSSNPGREVSYFKSTSEGFHTWTLEEVQQFEARHPIGNKARLTLALLLYTGQLQCVF